MAVKNFQTVVFLICGISVVLLFAGCEKHETVSGKDTPAITEEMRQVAGADPAGIYLAMGGMAYVEIVTDASGNLEIKETSLFPEFYFERQVSYNGKELKLIFQEKQDEMELREYYIFLPSSTTPGDWDLVRCHHWVGLTKDIPPDDEIPRLKQPTPSYLHRLDDRRVVDYFKALADYREVFGPGPDLDPKTDVASLFEIASGLLASYPDDLYVRTLYLDALVRKDDDKTLEEKLAAWQEWYTKANDHHVRMVLQFAEQYLYARRVSAASRNASDFVTKVLGSDTDLATRIELFPDILNYEEFTSPKGGLVQRRIANFLAHQISVKVFQVESVFLMLQGKREQALKILSASYHFGQLLNKSDTSIGRLIGIALRYIASAGLEVYALNCCETADDFRQLWETLEELNRRSLPGIVEGLVDFAFITPEINDQNILEAETRHRCADAKFQLVRMATAAKHRFVTKGVFPQSAEEFAPLLPEGPPKDPFGFLDPMKFISDPSFFACYSIGPDKQDNRAMVT